MKSVQKKLVEKLATKFKIKSFGDWKNISIDDVKNESEPIRNLFDHNGSIIPTINALFPKTKTLQQKYDWNLLSNQREFLQFYAQSKNIKNWTSVTTTDIIDFGGSGLLNCYGGSLFNALKTLYPEHYWDDKLKSRYPKDYFIDYENQRHELMEIGKKLCLLNWRDWYKVVKSDFTRNGGATILKLYDDSHIDAICNIFFEYPWDITLFKRVKT